MGFLSEKLQLFCFHVFVLFKANVSSRYRRTFAGLLWVLMNPLALFSVQFFVFGKIIDLSLPNYGLFLLGGLLPWIFINQTILMSASSILNQGRLLQTFSISPLAFLFSQVVDNFINFLLAFLIILTFLLSLYQATLETWWLLPFACLLLFAFVCALSLLVSTIQVFFRDTVFVISFVFTVIFFMTPIFYSVDHIPERYQPLIKLNPLRYLIKPFQDILMNLPADQALRSLSDSFLLVLFLSLISGFIWSRKQHQIHANI